MYNCCRKLGKSREIQDRNKNKLMFLGPVTITVNISFFDLTNI